MTRKIKPVVYRQPGGEAYGSEADRIQLADGCTLVQVDVDGVTWYKVVKA